MKQALMAPLFWQEDIKKSKFLVHAAPVQNEAEVLTFFKTHSDLQATHNCWAFRCQHIYRFNDDGEPSGTAGKPILAAIDGQNADQIAILIVRYFGGIKLGAGGLIRAYGGSASRCLQQNTAKWQPIEFKTAYFADCLYSDWPLIENELKKQSVAIENLVFNAVSVDFEILCTNDQALHFKTFLPNATKGRTQLKSSASILE